MGNKFINCLDNINRKVVDWIVGEENNNIGYEFLDVAQVSNYQVSSVYKSKEIQEEVIKCMKNY